MISGKIETVKPLIERYICDPTSRDTGKKNGTPLLYACSSGQIEVVKYLVNECHCKPASSTIRERKVSLLHEACCHGQLEIFKFLIEKCQSDPNVKDRDGVKPIYYACFDSHIDIIEYLLSTGKSSCILSESKNLIHRIQSVACRFTKFGKSIPVDSYINVLLLGNPKAGKFVQSYPRKNKFTLSFWTTVRDNAQCQS